MFLKTPLELCLYQMVLQNPIFQFLSIFFYFNSKQKLQGILLYMMLTKVVSTGQILTPHDMKIAVQGPLAYVLGNNSYFNMRFFIFFFLVIITSVWQCLQGRLGIQGDIYMKHHLGWGIFEWNNIEPKYTKVCSVFFQCISI